MISHAVWLYYRFTLSFRDIEEMRAVRGVQISYESIRHWCLKFPKKFTKSLRKHQGNLGDIWYLDEVLITINGKRQYLWRAVDQDGDVIDVLMQSPYGANIRTNRMTLLSNNITDNLFSNDERLKSLPASGHRPGRVA